MLRLNEQIDRLIGLLLEAEKEVSYSSAVGIVQCKDKYLLGLSTATDDRENKWCFPGGGIHRGETPKKAAVREVFEETGIRCQAVGDIIKDSNKPKVAFYHCNVTKHDQKFDMSKEFRALGWFKLSDMRGLKLHGNVKRLISKI